MKTCTKCDMSKPLSDFSTYFCPSRKVVTHRGKCRLCTNLRKRERYAQGLYVQCPVRKRELDLKRKYAITPKDYTLMLEEQDSKCFICLTPAKTPISLFVDHNHDTGKVRGLLCHPCNSALGLLKDDPTVLARAVTYLLEKGDYSQL